MTNETLTPDLIAFVRDQKDRYEIYQCMLDYTRGIDRHERDRMVSAYHPDAYDEHGLKDGRAGEFVDWAISHHGDPKQRYQHYVTNHRVELDGDVAHAETYYLYLGSDSGTEGSLAGGRYIDRLEKRDGRWAIAHRVCVNDTVGGFSTLPRDSALPLFSTGPNNRLSDDISNMRPLGSTGAR